MKQIILATIAISILTGCSAKYTPFSPMFLCPKKTEAECQAYQKKQEELKKEDKCIGAQCVTPAERSTYQILINQ